MLSAAKVGFSDVQVKRLAPISRPKQAFLGISQVSDAPNYNRYNAIAAQASASAKACFISVEGSGDTRWATDRGAWCSSG